MARTGEAYVCHQPGRFSSLSAPIMRLTSGTAGSRKTAWNVE